ncbi:MAG: TIGR04282 family arsenosugar biosynthesis glycosyltransferase [Thermodesulfobacteriota bacterium]
MKRVDCHLMVFVKAPIPGRVKTRMIPAMGEDAAAALYKKMVLYCLTEAVEADVGPVDLWCAAPTDHPFVIDCISRFPINVHSQIEGDLGQRMAHAFSEALKKTPCALLMGADCPSLSRKDIKLAKTTLAKDNDAVIVPSEDGGYVLIGLRRYARELFSEISWGTEFVLEQTRARLRHLGWNWKELPARWDVDRPEDLQRLALKRDFHFFDVSLDRIRQMKGFGPHDAEPFTGGGIKWGHHREHDKQKVSG